ncbi:MAG: hypothetical protein C4575_02160 [Desulforudis sp.]|jgi:hypothetical protein|nr:MAG: hypothetical protein C4575_02160 [Desulforudis sp.]
MSDGIALALINDVPVIGARFSQRERALAEAKRLTERVALFVKPGGEATVEVNFEPQNDGRYTLQLYSVGEMIVSIPGLDELTLWRFKKAYSSKKMFILTCFVNSTGKEAESLVETDGLGVVIYKPAAAGKA